MKPDAKAIPARVYAHVVCPDCKRAMVNYDDYLACITHGCKYRGVKWSHPVLTLIKKEANKYGEANDE